MTRPILWEPTMCAIIEVAGGRGPAGRGPEMSEFLFLLAAFAAYVFYAKYVKYPGVLS